LVDVLYRTVCAELCPVELGCTVRTTRNWARFFSAVVLLFNSVGLIPWFLSIACEW